MRQHGPAWARTALADQCLLLTKPDVGTLKDGQRLTTADVPVLLGVFRTASGHSFEWDEANFAGRYFVYMRRIVEVGGS